MEQRTIILSKRATLVGVAFLTVHFLFVGAYVLPDKFVPRIAQHWSNVWVRPFFHQKWQLFAPDPPFCSCDLQVRQKGAEEWISIRESKEHYLWPRSIDGLCRYLEMERGTGFIAVQEQLILTKEVRRASFYIGIEGEIEAQVVQQCVRNEDATGSREMEITRIGMME